MTDVRWHFDTRMSESVLQVFDVLTGRVYVETRSVSRAVAMVAEHNSTGVITAATAWG